MLIYPYYTVNAGQQSTLTLSNTTDYAKAVRLAIHEGTRGDTVTSFNVYLAANDTWTGALFSLSTTGEPWLISNDSTCTVPDLHATELPSLADGRHYLIPNVAGLPTTARPREGYVVAIEMGVVGGALGDSLAPASSADGASPDCSTVNAAWQHGGAWQRDPATGLSPPTGGLAGTMTILNVAEGTSFRVDATALKAFRNAAMNRAPTADHPNLGDASVDPATGLVPATIAIDDRVVQSSYPADRAIDAVSAVLMSQRLNTHYDFRAIIGAQTTFVVTLPTKPFYANDPSHPLAPFGRDVRHTVSTLGTLCAVADIQADGLDGGHPTLYLDSPRVPLGPPDSPLLCYATTTLAAPVSDAAKGGLFDSGLVEPLMSTGHRNQAGPATLTMNYYPVGCYGAPDQCSGEPVSRDVFNLLRPDTAGRQYFGLPLVGFTAISYVNRTGPGGARHYTFTTPLHRVIRCAENDVLDACH